MAQHETQEQLQSRLDESADGGQATNETSFSAIAADTWTPKDRCQTNTCDDFKSNTNTQLIEKGARLELTNNTTNTVSSGSRKNTKSNGRVSGTSKLQASRTGIERPVSRPVTCFHLARSL